MKQTIRKKSFLLLLGLFSFTYGIKYNTYNIPQVGRIDIPELMELQSGSYKVHSENHIKTLLDEHGITNSDQRIVFQQKGLNTRSTEGSSTYARIIIETVMGNKGDMEKLTSRNVLDPNDLSYLDNIFKQRVTLDGSKIITWFGTKNVTINGINVIKTSYIRRLGSNPSVKAEMYRYQNYDRMHVLTLAYRIEDRATFQVPFEKVLNSFKITNIK